MEADVKARIEQIRERQSGLHADAQQLGDDWCTGTSVLNDIDFLLDFVLSLVKSQEAAPSDLARVHAPTGKVSEGDRELIEAVAMPWICVEEKPCGETTAVHWEELITALTAALATVRREEREAAFKEAAGIARMMAAGETYETGRQKALNIAAALEASASDKGEMNGSDQTTKETRTDSGDL